MMRSGRRSTGSAMTGWRSRRRIAAGETRRSMGRAQPSCASTYQPGLPSNQAPLAIVNFRGSPWRWNDVRTRICVASCESSRSKRGRSASSPKRSSIICGSTMTRRPLSSGSRSLASSPRTSMPTRRGPWFSNRASTRIASRSAVGRWSWATSSALGSSGTRASGSSSVIVRPPPMPLPPCPTGLTCRRYSICLGAGGIASGSQASTPVPAGPPKPRVAIARCCAFMARARARLLRLPSPSTPATCTVPPCTV